MSEKYLQWLKSLIAKNDLSDFYTSGKWKRLASNILKTQGECQICKSNHRYGKAEIAHHVNTVRQHPELALSELAPDGSKNIIAVCRDCHARIHSGLKGYANPERW